MCREHDRITSAGVSTAAVSNKLITVLGCRGVPGLPFYPESINAVVNIKTFIHRAGNPK